MMSGRISWAVWTLLREGKEEEEEAAARYRKWAAEKEKRRRWAGLGLDRARQDWGSESEVK
jgi:hypothetical protein